MAGIQGFNSFNQNVGGVNQKRATGALREAQSDSQVQDGFTPGESLHLGGALGGPAETLAPYAEAPKTSEALPEAYTPSTQEPTKFHGHTIGTGIGVAGSGTLRCISVLNEVASTSNVDAPKGSTEGVHMNGIHSTEFFGLSGRRLT